MNARRAIALTIACLVASSALAQDVAAWDLPLRRVRQREQLCSMDTARRGGPCEVVAQTQVGAWTALVIRPRDHGTYLGDTTMKWHLVLERGARRWATEQPIHHEVTVCTDSETFRFGGHDAFVVEELAARDLDGDGAPELVLRWRESPGTPVRLHLCSLRGSAPRCAGPFSDAPVTREGETLRIGDRALSLP